MTPEERSLLESTHQLAKENNQMLHKLNRRSRWGIAVKTLYWVLIIGLSFGAFYFIQPYIDFVRGFGGNDAAKSQSNGAASQTYTQQLQELLK